MSAVNLGIDHDSDEVVAFKATISNKDNELTMLRVHLEQAAQQRTAADITLKETNYKLQSEADRRVKLEEELRITSEARINQKTAHDNVELALNQLQERFKAEQKVVRDLQATIDSLTARTEGDKQGRLEERSALDKRNSQLQSRIKELEFECHQLKAAPRSKFTNGRTSSSTVTTDPQFIWLQQENERLRDLVTKHGSDTEAFEKRIGQLQTEMTKMENEKVANERSWQAKVKELQDKVDDMDEELEHLRQQTGEGSASREQQLMDRIDEDAAKMEQIQREVAQAQRMQSTLVQTEEKLRAEMKKVEEAETVNVDLVRERDTAWDELETFRAESEAQQQQIRQLQMREKELQQQVDEAQNAFAESTFRIPMTARQSISRQIFEDNLMEEDADLTYLIRSTPSRPENARSSRRSSLGQQPVDFEVVERLLATIDRLRGERDDVKGHLEFSQIEHRFAVQALEHRILALSSTTESDKSLEVSNLEDEIRQLRVEANIALAKVEDSQLEARRSQLAASAFTVVVDRVRANNEYLTAQYGTSLQVNEGLLSDANRRATIAESQLSEAVKRYDQAEHNRQLLSSRVEELEGIIQRFDREASENKVAYHQLNDDLEAAKATMDHLRKVIQEVEAERDSLNLRIAHLEDDLSTARTEQEDLRNRYQTLQSQHLSSMSSTQASKALRQQIEELEDRVKRRTEQVAMHQHDIRRLETNLRLHEDRIAEMTVDIETLTNQKVAMVEDCAEAREARDHAIQRVELLEEQAESFEEKLLGAKRERDVEVATLVEVVAQAISDKRNATLQLKALLFESEKYREVQGQLHHAKEHIHSLAQQVRELESVIASNTQDAMDVDGDSTTTITENLHQVTVALALSQAAYRDAVGSLSLTRGQCASAEARVSSLQRQLQALTDHQSVEEDASRIRLQSHISELESTIRGLEQTLHEAKSHQEQTSHQLTRAQEELHSHAERAEEQARRIAGLQVEIEELSGVQSDQAYELQQQLEKARSELADALRVRDEADVEYGKLKAEVDTTKGELNAQLKQVQELSIIRASLEKELSEVRLTQTEGLTRLQEELSKATAAAEKASTEHDTISKERQTAIDQLAHAKSEIEEKLADTETRFTTLQQQFDEKYQAWTQSERKLQDELRFTIERSHKTEADLHRTIRTLKANLEESSSALETVNEEKNTMEADMTNLKAEVQRHRTLSQYLEKQVKEQESEISDLGGRLAALRKDYAALEQESSGTELQLSIKDTQHKESIAALQRELNALREKPNLEARLQELQEKCDEMEEDLKEKCAEIERTDDKYLVVLKERKKLNFQVDSLTRKVKALEKELSDATNKLAPKAKEPSTSKPPTQAPVPARTASTSSRRNTSTNSSQPSSRSSSTRTSAVSSTESPHLLQSTRPLASTSTSSSSLQRTKTPEPKVRHEAKPAPAPTVQAQQPEPVTIGKKRRAPDDFDACESVPAQVFTPDCVPGKASENRTPRSRKMTTGNRSGFTPVRSRPPSKDPVGRIAAPVLSSTATISDVTNGTTQRSVTQPAPPKTQASQPPVKARSWLRNVKPPVAPR